MMIRSSRAALALFLLAAGAGAEEPLPGAFPATAVPPLATRTVQGDLLPARAYRIATPDVRVAMCGLEADIDNTNLDAGLIDFNVADKARAAGGALEDGGDSGKNVRDYRKAVFLGVTLGYRF